MKKLKNFAYKLIALTLLAISTCYSTSWGINLSEKIIKAKEQVEKITALANSLNPEPLNSGNYANFCTTIKGLVTETKNTPSFSNEEGKTSNANWDALANSEEILVQTMEKQLFPFLNYWYDGKLLNNKATENLSLPQKIQAYQALKDCADLIEEQVLAEKIDFPDDQQDFGINMQAAIKEELQKLQTMTTSSSPTSPAQMKSLQITLKNLSTSMTNLQTRLGNLSTQLTTLHKKLTTLKSAA